VDAAQEIKNHALRRDIFYTRANPQHARDRRRTAKHQRRVNRHAQPNIKRRVVLKQRACQPTQSGHHVEPLTDIQSFSFTVAQSTFIKTVKI
jgi:hypothetical protein